MMIVFVGIVCIATLGWLHALDRRDSNPNRTAPTRAQRRAWKRERLAVDAENRRRP